VLAVLAGDTGDKCAGHNWTSLIDNRT